MGMSHLHEEPAASGSPAPRWEPEPAKQYGPGPQLVILAAGLGSRYGGLKQLEPVGPGGATMLEYSLYDARRAGFGEVIFVIRPEMVDEFSRFAAGRFGTRVPIRTVLQRLEDTPPGTSIPNGRTAPWGTAQAVLAAAPVVTGPFAVANADDCYGPEAFAALAAFFAAHGSDRPPSYAVAGYRLRETTSEAGPVNRGVCRTDAAGWLEMIEEVKQIEADDDGTFAGHGEWGSVRLAGDTVVSMNLWGFTPPVFDLLRRGFSEFFQALRDPRAEYLIPGVIRSAVRRGACRVKVLEAGGRWFGITHPADRPMVEAALRGLVEQGRYPAALWS
jgi:MobA-like NTP transferase domain